MSLVFIVLSCNRTQNCATDGQTEWIRTYRHTDEIIYVRFRRYVCINFVNFLLCKKYIAQLFTVFLPWALHQFIDVTNCLCQDLLWVWYIVVFIYIHWIFKLLDLGNLLYIHMVYMMIYFIYPGYGYMDNPIDKRRVRKLLFTWFF